MENPSLQESIDPGRRSIIEFVRRADPHSRPLQYFVIARRPDAMIPPA